MLRGNARLTDSARNSISISSEAFIVCCMYYGQPDNFPHAILENDGRGASNG